MPITSVVGNCAYTQIQTLPLRYKIFIVRTSSGPFIVHAPFAIGMVATMVSAGFEVVIAKLRGRDVSWRNRLRLRREDRQFRCRF